MDAAIATQSGEGGGTVGGGGHSIQLGGLEAGGGISAGEEGQGSNCVT